MKKSFPYTTSPTHSLPRRLLHLSLILLLTLILLAALFLLLFRGYVTDSPLGPSLKPPLLGPSAPAFSSSDAIATEASAQEPKPLPEETHALAITVDDFLASDLSKTLKEGGYNSIVVEMKPQSGKLEYLSN